MENNLDVNRVIVLNSDGEPISTSYANRAIKMIYDNKAVVVSKDPLTIRLLNQVEVKNND